MCEKLPVEALKNTYGRDGMLIKIYVRDLIQRMVQKAILKKVDLVELVPQLTSQIRNLEQRGVTSDKCQDILYPMVESCLPEEVLQAWQRNPGYINKLEYLLKFLNWEVHNQMERSPAKMEFGTATSLTSSQPRKGVKAIKQSDIATAAALSNITSGGGGKKVCPFCDGLRHSPWKCQNSRKR